MKLFSVFFFISFLAATCFGEIILPASETFQLAPEKNREAMSPSFSMLYNQLMDAYSVKNNKRDFLQDNLEGLLSSLQSSGVILDVLHEIANSPDEMNTLSSYIFKTLVSISTNTAISGLNVTINATEILDKVKSSGIITSTLNGLLLDQTQRDIFTDNLGEVLVNNTWISKLVLTLGETGQVSWETIFNLARNTKSKDPLFNGTFYTYKHSRIMKRDDSSQENYNGSLLSFINNIVGSVISSDLLDNSLDSILSAVQGSGIIIPTIQEALSDQSIQNMFGFIANKLYNYGVFDQIPINKMFQDAKKSGIISNVLQKSFTNDIQSYVFGNIFLRLEQQGVFNQIRRNLYGPN